MPNPPKGPDDPITNRDRIWMRNSAPVRRIYAKIGDPLNIPDEWIENYIRQARQKKIDLLKAEKISTFQKKRAVSRAANLETREREEERQKLIQEYFGSYSVSAPNDREDLDQLVNLQIQARDISIALEKVRDRKTEADAKIGKLATEELRLVLQSISDIQKRLHIDRRTRERLRTEQSADKVIQEIVAQAKEFLAEEVIEFICPKCNSLTGWFWQLSGRDAPRALKFLCPCGTQIESREGW